MATQTITLHPILKAIDETKKFVEAGQFSLTGKNPKQDRFLELFLNNSTDLQSLSETEMRSMVSKKAEELNQFLTDNGFDIALADFPRLDDFGAVAIMKILVSWVKKGMQTKMYSSVDFSFFDAAIVNGNISVITNRKEHPHPILEITTANGDCVYMTIASKEKAEFELLDTCVRLNKSLQDREAEIDGSYTRAAFPMISIDQKPDISWLEGLQIMPKDGTFYTLAEALQQTKFCMDECGAKVESAVAVAVTRSMPPPEKIIQIDEPFFLWITRNGMNIPYFAAYLDRDCWKKPTK